MQSLDFTGQKGPSEETRRSDDEQNPNSDMDMTCKPVNYLLHVTHHYIHRIMFLRSVTFTHLEISYQMVTELYFSSLGHVLDLQCARCFLSGKVNELYL